MSATQQPFPPEPTEEVRVRRLITRAVQDAVQDVGTQNGNGSPATQSTAIASGGVSAAVVGIIIWILSLSHITVPAEVAADFVVIVAAAIHAIGLQTFYKPKDPPPP